MRRPSCQQKATAFIQRLHVCLRECWKCWKKTYFSSPLFFTRPSFVLGPLFVLWFLRTSASVCFFIPVSYSEVIFVFVSLFAVSVVSLSRSAATPMPVFLLIPYLLSTAIPFTFSIRTLLKGIGHTCSYRQKGKIYKDMKGTRRVSIMLGSSAKAGITWNRFTPMLIWKR